MVLDDDTDPRPFRPVDTSRPIPNIPEPGSLVRRCVAEAMLDYPEWSPNRIAGYIKTAMSRHVTADQVRYVLAVPRD